MIRLYLIRHAKADKRGPDYPDDSLRPLIKRGKKQARALAKTLDRLGVRFDRLLSSPYTRARQTAEALRDHAGEGVQELAALADYHYDALLHDLNGALEEGQQVALVGHEPYLSELAALLLTGRTDGLRIRFRKGSMLLLSGPLEKAKMTLESHLAPKHYWRRT